VDSLAPPIVSECEPRDSLGAVWRTYGLWALWVGIAFFAIYPTCNWWTARRALRFHLYLESELRVPFVPEAVWIYFSMYALFAAPPFFLGVRALRALGPQILGATLASGLIFLLVPTELGFARVVPDSPLHAAVFAAVFSVDLPHNMVPSLHVVWSGLILLALRDYAGSPSRVRHTLLSLWLGAICASTLFVHQHHLADVLASLLLVWGLRVWIPGPAARSVHA
jgi:hypothetical protein